MWATKHPSQRAVRGGYDVQVVVDASGSDTAISEEMAVRSMLRAACA